MKITVQEQTDQKLQFTLSGVTSAYANTLRRLMLGEVPTMAIEDVTFFRNDSVLYDEIVAHRLGLVVWRTDLDTYNMTSVCKCKGAGCSQCQVKIGLQAEGPKTIYAKDLESADPSVKAIYPDTVIVKLLEGQKLEFDAIATLGIGKEHSKWNPGLIWYRNEAQVKVNNKSKDFEAYKDQYPTQVFNDKGEIDATLITSRPEYIDACMEVNPEIVSITLDKDSFVFTVESFGALPAKEIVTRALEIYDGQLDAFKKLLTTI